MMHIETRTSFVEIKTIGLLSIRISINGFFSTAVPVIIQKVVANASKIFIIKIAFKKKQCLFFMNTAFTLLSASVGVILKIFSFVKLPV
ncbi:hypothetical protein CL634_09030 [bacterium]|nr:hypothetical protein [bacterium]|tara:strand:+ start:1064 stop:1330 length:267 start_codon:yes stop_codon:yes gene_type:complete